MSFSELLNKAVQSVVVSFIDVVSSEYSIPKDDLLNLFNGDSKVSAKSKTKVQPSTELDKGIVVAKSELKLQPSAELNKLNKNELIAHCKAKGLKTTGTKQELIDRLTNGASTPVAVPEKKVQKKSSEPPVITKVQNTIQTVQIKKNSFGNFEHSESGLVFDKVSQKVIGKQNASGKVDSLTDEDIEVCNKYKFSYQVPENLNVGVKNSVAIEGLDEEEDEDDGTDIINEAEELLEEDEELLEEDEGGEEEFYEDDE